MKKGKATIFFNKNFQMPILLFLIGVIIMISADIVFPNDNNSNGGTDMMPDTGTGQSGSMSAQDLLRDIDNERRLLEIQIENLIESMSGVRDATVVITFENSGELSTITDGESSNSTMTEADGSGGSRNTTESSNNDRVVYVEGSDGSRVPFVVSERAAQVRGVAVVIRGEYNPTVKEQVTRALEVLLSLPPHKIQVMY